MNEIITMWSGFVTSNYDILIMTITLIVVGGLVLEVVRLKNRIKSVEERLDWNIEDLCGKFYHLEDRLSNDMEDQVNINVHLAEDMMRIDKKINQLKMTTDAWGIKTPKKK